MREQVLFSRRAAALSLAAIGTPAFAVAGKADIELLTLGSELETVHAKRGALDDANDFDDDALYHRHWELREAINRIRAVSIAGVAVKARAAQMALHYDPQNENEGDGAFRDLSISLIEDIIEIAKKGATS